MVWDPQVYLTFADARTRPAIDLLARVALDAPRRVVDLGCGPGNSTALLMARYPKADTFGLDSSAAMIATARRDAPGATYAVGDMDDWAEAGVDLIFSNAAFQWSQDAVGLIARLASLKPRVFAFQAPQNFAAPSHIAIRATLDDAPWSAYLSDPALRRQFPDPATLFRLLKPHFETVDVWETEYLHVLDGPDPVFRWVSGTALTPIFAALPGDFHADFRSALKERLARAYPPELDGRTLFAFKRVFAVAA